MSVDSLRTEYRPELFVAEWSKGVSRSRWVSFWAECVGIVMRWGRRPESLIRDPAFNRCARTPYGKEIWFELQSPAGWPQDTDKRCIIALGGGRGLRNALLDEGIAVVRLSRVHCLASPNDRVIDVDTVYQYLVKQCHIHPNNIGFYGFCMGGAIAARVKALHPDSRGPFLGDRSFLIFSRLVSREHRIVGWGRGIEYISEWISCLIQRIFGLVFRFLGLELDVSQSLMEMSGEKMVICIEEELLISPTNQLHIGAPEESLIRGRCYRAGVPTTHNTLLIDMTCCSEEESLLTLAVNFLGCKRLSTSVDGEISIRTDGEEE